MTTEQEEHTIEIEADVTTAVIQALDHLDSITIDHTRGGVEITDQPRELPSETQDKNLEYEVQGAIAGRLEFADVFDDQGRLLYIKNGIEVMLHGIEDGHLLFAVTIRNDEI